MGYSCLVLDSFIIPAVIVATYGPNMSHMLHSSLLGSLFATPLPPSLQDLLSVWYFTGALLEKEASTLKYSAAFEQRFKL